MKAEFYINNTQIYVKDTFKFPFKVIKEVLTAGNVGGRSGIRSYSVELPVTRELLQALNINNYLDNKNKFFTTLQYDFKIIINSNVFFKGVFYLNSYDRFNIRGFFVSNNVDWSNSIAGKTLNDIESLEPYNFKGMQSIIQNQQAQLLNSSTHNFQNNVCFPLIAYGTYFLHYWPKQTKYIDTTDYSGIVNNPAQLIDGFLITNSDIPHLSFEDIPPAYYIVNILRAIFKDAGWAISGSWIGTINDLILPTCGVEKVSYNWGFLVDVQLESNTFNYTNGAPAIPIPDFIDSSGFPVLGYKYLSRNFNTFKDTGFNCGNPNIFGDFYVPEDGIYEITYFAYITSQYSNVPSGANFHYPIIGFFQVDPEIGQQLADGQTLIVAPTAPLFQSWYSIQIQDSYKLVDLNGNPVYDEIILPPLSGATPINTVISRTFQTRLLKGQIIRMSLITDTNGSINQIVGIFNNFNYSIQNVSGDQLFDIAKNLPSMSQTDFINGLIDAFNLYFTTDDLNKIIYFEEQSKFLLGNDIAVDVTELTSDKQATISLCDVPEKYTFKFKEDSDDFLVEETVLEILPIYQQKNGTQIVECEFSETETFDFVLVVNDQAINATALQNPIFNKFKTIEIPMITNEEQFNSLQFDDVVNGVNHVTWKYKFQPRLLRTRNQNVSFIGTGLGSGVALRVWDYGANLDVIIRGEVMPTAAFLDTVEAMKNKYVDFITILERSHVVTIDVVMDANLWNKLNPQVPVKMNGNYYILQKIGEFNILKEKDVVSLELIKK